MKKVLNFAADLLFPRRCPWCGKVIGFTVCEACVPKTELLKLHGERVDTASRHHTCPSVAAVYALYEYDGVVKDCIRRMKFKGEEELAGFLGEKLTLKAQTCGLAGNCDIVVPVPQYKDEKRERGYNQAALMAVQVATGLACAFVPEVLEKQRQTERQASLGREKRRTNLKGAFCVPQASKVQGKCVLLVDDVITTGSTMEECAKTLLAAGARECRVLCVASTGLGGDDSDGK